MRNTQKAFSTHLLAGRQRPIRKAHQDEPSPATAPKTDTATGAHPQDAVCLCAAEWCRLRSTPPVRSSGRAGGPASATGREGWGGAAPRVHAESAYPRLVIPHAETASAPLHHTCGEQHGPCPRPARRDRGTRATTDAPKPRADKGQKADTDAAEGSAGSTRAYPTRGADRTENCFPPSQCCGRATAENPPSQLSAHPTTRKNSLRDSQAPPHSPQHRPRDRPRQLPHRQGALTDDRPAHTPPDRAGTRQQAGHPGQRSDRSRPFTDTAAPPCDQRQTAAGVGAAHRADRDSYRQPHTPHAISAYGIQNPTPCGKHITPHRQDPAGAGSSWSSPPSTSRWQVHSRGCGEQGTHRGRLTCFVGPSPRKRGAARTTTPPPWASRVHPRASEEPVPKPATFTAAESPSPRKQGTDRRPHHRAALDPSIPTRAGNRSSGSGPASPATIPTHPRAQPRGTGRSRGERGAWLDGDPPATQTPAGQKPPRPDQCHAKATPDTHSQLSAHPTTRENSLRGTQQPPTLTTGHPDRTPPAPPPPGPPQTPQDRQAAVAHPGTDGRRGAREGAATATALTDTPLARTLPRRDPGRTTGAEAARHAVTNTTRQPPPRMRFPHTAYRLRHYAETASLTPPPLPRARSSAGSRTSRQQSRAHPHERREQRVQGATAEALLGPSPHEREQLTASWTDTGTSGPSPQERGARRHLAGQPRHRGSIPARAGSTAPARAWNGLTRVHPRGRGEHLFSTSRPYETAGPSPRERGAAVERPARQRLQGYIPARAGSRAS